MAPRPDVSDQRRHQIMDAAFAVFSRLGFERASMDDIAKEAGVSKGALYLYYKSKDAIISKLLQIFFDQAFKQIRTIAAGEGSAAEQLLTFAHVLTREMDRMVAVQPITLQFYAIAARHEETRRLLRIYFSEYCKQVEAIVQRGVAQGEFRADLNPAEVAITHTALFEGLALLWLVNPQGTDWHKQVESATKLLLQGLGVSPDAPAG
ncbi:MAG TPA: TetR/AcrR family transcriptional regulator [Ktedonobacterales bacterium]|nr:TetR/AcrR family transcriptional regulator [Ktedonobacterales bacterium]